MINKIINYVQDNDLKIKYINNTLNVVNYDVIINLDDNEIIFKIKNKLLTIKGENLVLKKVLNQEVLISGIIKSIEM